jgi:hypothetical protein
MPTYPNPAGGSMQAANDTAARAQGWTPSMGTFGANTYPSGDGGGGGGSSGGGGVQGANVQAGQMLLQQAQNAANQAYLNAKLQLDSDTVAYQKAAQEAATAIAQAGVTGTFNGMPTQAAIKQAADIAQQQASQMLGYATTFGAWGMPQQGQLTQAAQQQAFSQGQSAAGLTGWYTPYTYTPPQAGAFPAGMGTPTVGPGSTAGGGTSTSWDALSNLMRQQAGASYNDAAGKAAFNQITGFNGGGTPTNLTADQLAQIVSAGTGGQMTSYAALTGQAQPTAAQPGAQQGQAGTQYFGAPPGYQAGQPVQTLAGQAQDLARWTAQQTAAQNYLTMLTNLRGPADWAKYQQVLGATPQGTQDLVRAAAGQYIPGGGATTGVQPQAADLNTLYNQATGGAQSGQQQLQNMQNTLVAPNQMAPQTWNALQPSQQQMLLGVWESQGYNKEDAQNLFNQSLPKYATSGPSSGSFRLQ